MIDSRVIGFALLVGLIALYSPMAAFWFAIVFIGIGVVMHLWQESDMGIAAHRANEEWRRAGRRPPKLRSWLHHADSGSDRSGDHGREMRHEASAGLYGLHRPNQLPCHVCAAPGQALLMDRSIALGRHAHGGVRVACNWEITATSRLGQEEHRANRCSPPFGHPPRGRIVAE